MANPAAVDDREHAAPSKSEPIFCTLTGDVVHELALEVHIDEEHSMIILEVAFGGVLGLRVVFGPDAMLDLCRRGLGAVMKLKRLGREDPDLSVRLTTL
jgi:hypothetical protein